MTGQELYEKYAGERAKVDGLFGIVVGYNNSYDFLIIAITNDDGNEECWRWHIIGGRDEILNMNHNQLGYRYAEEYEIITKFRFGR